MNKLNSTQLKIIALAIMTIDHIAAYGMNIFPFLPYDIFRCIGRSAMPLFMYALVIGAGYTRSKAKFLLRLYIANLLIFLIWSPLFILFKGSFAKMPSMLTTYLYVLIYSYGIEKTFFELKKRKFAALLYLPVLAAITLIPGYVLNLFYDPLINMLAGGSPDKNNLVYVRVVEALLNTLLPTLEKVDGSIYLVAMGVIWYFIKNKYACAGVLIFFGIWGFLGANNDIFDVIGTLGGNHYSYCTLFFNEMQPFMIFAALFMLLYNGMRGRAIKYFFYIYYPLHVFVISAINCLLVL